MHDRFGTFHPAVGMLFFAGALLFGMLLIHPAYLAIAFACAVLYRWTARGAEGLRMVGALLILMMVLTALNPLFGGRGETVLFIPPWGRPYTMEALCYGGSLSLMVGTMLLWFAGYQEVMTSDKLLFLFGRLAPSAAMIFTMVLRLVPAYRQKTMQLDRARTGIGKSAAKGSVRERACHGMILLSVLTSWALEGGVITADSMRSRGYGCGKRTFFSLYRWEGRDFLLLGGMLILLGALTACCALGGARASFLPALSIAGMEYLPTRAGLTAYAAFLFLPSGINLGEELRWHSLKSKI